MKWQKISTLSRDESSIQSGSFWLLWVTMEIPQKVARIILHKQCNTCVFPELKEPQNKSSAAVFDNFCLIWLLAIMLRFNLKKKGVRLFIFLGDLLYYISATVQLLMIHSSWQASLHAACGGDWVQKKKRRKKQGVARLLSWQQRHIYSNLLIQRQCEVKEQPVLIGIFPTCMQECALAPVP